MRDIIQYNKKKLKPTKTTVHTLPLRMTDIINNDLRTHTQTMKKPDEEPKVVTWAKTIDQIENVKPHQVDRKSVLTTNLMMAKKKYKEQQQLNAIHNVAKMK